MAKPVPQRVASDDCAVTIGGAVYHPHEGEWVEAHRVWEVRDNSNQVALGGMQVELDAVKGDEDEAVKARAIIERHYDNIIQSVTERVTAWTWTNLRSQPLGERLNGVKGPRIPDAATLKALSPDEVFYLWRVVRGETPDEEKKDSPDSPTTSSDTAPAPTQE